MKGHRQPKHLRSIIWLKISAVSTERKSQFMTTLVSETQKKTWTGGL